ncbi:exopolyphosphatase PRUNE1 [Athalia rosae]|uniref:exopolyphosphatase PRUNE1 n=1 Tax=Athalia rosae TaxID=37344 RepID=UPI0020339016|nr:exopolyphosphatase PRUNE1 [Athalia rosae]
MDSFLNTSKSSLANLENYSHVRVVIGNMACDLDSAVCAIVYAFHLHTVLENGEESIAVIPILNIPEKEFRLKTEVVYYLEKYRISQQVLTFRDQIDLTGLSDEGKLEVVLVDHHALCEKDKELAKSVIEVIDHRPQDLTWLWQEKNVDIEMVGSCATLIGKKLLQTNSKALNSRVCNLLRGPILIDTANFSKKANKATPTDLEIIQRLEEITSIVSDREQDYREILSAKTNISGLTASDLLMKDLKITNGIPIPGLPMLVQV